MEQHSPHQAPTPTEPVDKNVFECIEELPENLRSLFRYAQGQYKPLIRRAEESDDEQETFTSAGERLVRGSELTAKIALVAASKLRSEMA